MSEKKEVEGGSKADDSKEIVDDKKKSKKDTSKKAKQNNTVEEDSNENSKETSSPEPKKTKATKSKKTKKSGEAENQNDAEEEFDDIDVKKKIPLLDQPPIIEGSRVRTSVLKFEQKQPEKAGNVTVPAGKGKPLGKIPIINERLKRLRIVTLKNLHRLIFGRIGKIVLVLPNIQKFNGFPFLEDSDDYNRKVTALNKLPMSELKELIFSFDLDMKLKKKDECAKEILNFLILPKTAEKTQNPSLSHPKRKATKRNYFDADVDEDETKKRKKSKPAADKKDKPSENGESSKVTAKSSKTNDKKANDDESKNDDQDSSNELKKPAKKRKRNQIIEEEENKKSKQDENEKKDAEGDEDSEDGATSDSQSPAQKSGNTKDKLSDEELKIFLKKVLADLNLENTTMKTVYNLISSEYPTYDFSKKKRFIKGVVKSLIQ